MHVKRTVGWYVTRIELAIGISAVLFAALLYVGQPRFMLVTPPWWKDPLTWAAYVGMLVGLVWMIRIFRGPGDEPPPWRYRDR